MRKSRCAIIIMLQEETDGKEERPVEDKKKNGTFVVHIKCCENATWQGEVTWAEKNKKESFRSALELLRLIDGALDMTEE